MASFLCSPLCRGFPYPEEYHGQCFNSSFFLTDNLWRLLERTEAPTVVAGIASLVYSTDSATGYYELEKKQQRIQEKSAKTTDHNLMLYKIGVALSYRDFDRKTREKNGIPPGAQQKTAPNPMYQFEREDLHLSVKEQWIVAPSKEE